MTKSSNSKRISFSDFCKISSVAYWRKQLSPANTKNIKNESQLGGTRNAYTYGLLAFHNWLSGRKFQYTTTIHTDKNIMQQYRTNISLDGVNHLLEISRENTSDKADFALLIKEYLAELSCIKSQSTIKNSMYSIRSFFRENQAEIPFQFMPRIKRNSKNHVKKCISLEEFSDILSCKNVQAIEKAVFCANFIEALMAQHLQTDSILRYGKIF